MDYLYGFGNHHQTEAIEGALPRNQNSPQQCPNGLYAEQISGTAFTRPRHQNLFSWVYRILPSVVSGAFTAYDRQATKTLKSVSPDPLRWSALSAFNTPCDFIDGLIHVAGHDMVNAYIYHCTQSMKQRYFANNDGELLFVPYEGDIQIKTEFGRLDIQPGHIAVIPRGVKFSIQLKTSPAAGYLCENKALPLSLPDLGPIGANGLAHARHFRYPVAAYETMEEQVTLVCKNQDHWWQASLPHSPLNVVAWHGNYAPYAYDLSLFNTVNTVSYDHSDPSIFTVLTSQSCITGVADLDFVIFPSRWLVAEHSFRPPYFHRNVMSEFMGNIYGQYDAKEKGFERGGFSIHNCMAPHGPDAQAFDRASKKALKPEKYINNLSFMFETRLVWKATEQALSCVELQRDYLNCWQGLKKQFTL